MNDENKIKLNAVVETKKEGLFIVTKRNPHTKQLVASPNPFQHWTKQEATTEAERLAKQFPGTEFYVFQAISTSLTEVAPVKTNKFKV